MLRTLLTAVAAAFCLVASAQTETLLNMGTQFGDANIDEITAWTQDGFTLTPSMGANPKEKTPCYKSKNKEVRLYALNTLEIEAPEGKTMQSISFSLSKQGVDEQAVITASTGSVATQEVGGKTVDWTGDAKTVTFTVGETNSLHPEGVVDGSGQFDFTVITITTADGSSAVVEISTDSADATPTYYDLNGKLVEHPQSGIFICHQNGKSKKIVVK